MHVATFLTTFFSGSAILRPPVWYIVVSTNVGTLPWCMSFLLRQENKDSQKNEEKNPL